MNNETKVGAMTPPPWEAQDQLGKLCVFGPEGECIAVCNSSIAPNEANARAIAALPELVEVLLGIYTNEHECTCPDQECDGQCWHSIARAALQKAGCL